MCSLRPTAALAVLPALMASALLTTGCGDNSPDPRSATTASRSRPGGPPTGDRAASLWSLIGEGGKDLGGLPDDDKDVAAVRKTVALHSGAVDNRGPGELPESLKTEYAYYTAEFRAALRTQDHDAQLTRLFRTNKLTTRQTKIAWYRSTLHTDRTTAKVEMDSVIEFTAATRDYLERGGFELRTPYTQHRTLSLVKRDGTWLIDRIDKTPLTRPSARPVPTG
ncbi:hypothetical protein HUT18_15185 [Streptomyces sp. NA04227]|uniref:hypothetical protein n=1 Tax=Streptomyces sp. NA04227 TaxID=2742136 RepID=UPI001590CCBE|nr:hypothetical protein [Streptomyces sp. NA04227]QKW07524.1 hypothetical protein HUT18_15185 [Streptomyces sp. NA04227]